MATREQQANAGDDHAESASSLSLSFQLCSTLPSTGIDIWLVGPRRLCEPLGHALLRVSHKPNKSVAGLAATKSAKDHDKVDQKTDEDEMPRLDAVQALQRHVQRQAPPVSTDLLQTRHVYMTEESRRALSQRVDFVILVVTTNQDPPPEWEEYVWLNRCVQLVVKERATGGGDGQSFGAHPPLTRAAYAKTNPAIPRLHCTYHYDASSSVENQNVEVTTEPPLASLAQILWKRALWATTSREASVMNAVSGGSSPLFSTLLL